jgi:hypothetical protein
MWTMDDRMQPGRENTTDRSAPSAPGTDEHSRNDRRTSNREEHSIAERSSASKPALTDRERRERWPVG